MINSKSKMLKLMLVLLNDFEYNINSFGGKFDLKEFHEYLKDQFLKDL